jgi:hypothetical protein
MLAEIRLHVLCYPQQYSFLLCRYDVVSVACGFRFVVPSLVSGR